MDTGHSFSESELSFLWNRKSKRYTIKSFTENGHWITHLVLNDKYDGGTVIGKLVKRCSDEFRQRPWLHHRNLASLVDMVTIHEDFTVFISPYYEKNLMEIVHEEKFVQSSNCFILKKIYIKDVLWGLDYLHRSGMCLMNLTDANVFICEQPNKAIITDFGCLTQVRKEGECKFAVPLIHQPPETRMGDGQCDLKAAEMWVAGMMAMEIFTQHRLPWALVDYDPDRVEEMIAKVDYDLLNVANAGSILSIQDLCEFKTFIDLFMDNDPKRRYSAKDAASAKFLQSPDDVAQRMAIRPNNGSEMKNKSESFPSIQKWGVPTANGANISETTGIPLDEIQTVKSKSDLSFKKCVSYAKRMNSDKQSCYDIRQPNYEDFDSNAISDSSNHVGKVNSVPKYNLNIDSPQRININCIGNNISPTKSKTSLSSQEEFPRTPSPITSVYESECNCNMPTSGYSDKSLNDGNDEFLTESRPLLSPNLKNLIDSHKKIVESCIKKFNEMKISDSPAKSAHLENSFEEVRVPCNIDSCATSNNNYEDLNRQNTSDQFYTSRILPNDSTRNITDESNRKWKSVDVGNDSFQKIQIPVSKNYPETFGLNSKLDSTIVSRNPFTLSESSYSSLPAHNDSDLMAKANQVVNEFKKEIDQAMFRQSEQINGQKSPLVNNIKPQNVSFSVIKRSNQPPGGAEKFRLKRNPVQTNVNNVPHCRFQHGYRCPRHQIGALWDKSINETCVEPKFSDNKYSTLPNIRQEARFSPNLKEYNSKNDNEACENISVESKVSDKNYFTLPSINQEGHFSPKTKEHTSENKCQTCENINMEQKVCNKKYSTLPIHVYPNYRTEYYFPARTLYDLKNPENFINIQVPGIDENIAKKDGASFLHQIAHYLPTLDGKDFHKNAKGPSEDVPGEENQLQMVGLRAPREQGRSLFRMEQTPKKRYTKKKAHQSPSLDGADLHKNDKDSPEDVPEEDNQLQEVVVLRPPREQGRPLFRMEHTPKNKRSTKKKAKKDTLRKSKKSGKNASTECIVVSADEDSGDEKKKSKKKKSLMKCFCLRK